MIDLHAHILPGLDDGARNWEEAVKMSEIARKDGIHTIVATPHIKPGIYSPSPEEIYARVVELNQRLPFKDLTILPGADFSFPPDLLTQVETGKAPFLPLLTPANTPDSIHPANQFRYLLLELPDYFIFSAVKEIIEKLQQKNIIPILSHPERIALIQKQPRLLYELIQAGALSQITAMSLTGEFGKDLQKFTRTLIKKNLVHIIASDAHSEDRRPPVLSRAITEAANIIGKEPAEKLVRENPRAIIEGKRVESES